MPEAPSPPRATGPLVDPHLVRGRSHDLGSGMELAEILTDDGELAGYTVSGPAWPACPSPYEGRCGGYVPIVAVEYSHEPRLRHVWQASGEWPRITLHPSVACGCGGQRAYIREGVWGGPPAPPAPGPPEPPVPPRDR